MSAAEVFTKALMQVAVEAAKAKIIALTVTTECESASVQSTAHATTAEIIRSRTRGAKDNASSNWYSTE